MYWRFHWEKQGYEVTAFPELIPRDRLEQLYPAVHREFYQRIQECDILFVANEGSDASGSIGAGVFAEIAFAVALRQLGEKEIKILLLNPPKQAIPELQLWLNLGWVEVDTA
jgi:hypothetical protein